MPARHRDTYDRFRKLFVNVLRLSHIRQDELKALLLSVYESEFEQLARRRARVAGRLVEHRTRLEHLDCALIQWLRQRYTDGEIETAFTALNRGLLGLPVDGAAPGLRILEAGAVQAALDQVLAGADARRVTVSGAEIDREAAGPVELAEYADRQEIQQAIDELEAEVAELEGALTAAADAESLRQRRDALEATISETEARLTLWRQLEEEEPQVEGWRRECQDLEGQEEELRQRQARLDEERAEHLRAGERLADDLRRIEGERTQLEAKLRNLPAPDENWPVVPLSEAPEGLDDLIWQYRRQRDEHESQDGQVRECLNRIERRTYGRYTGQDEADTVRRLEEQLESIPVREEAVRELWTSIAVGVKKSLSSLGRDLDQLKLLVQGLNREIARVPVSNLSSLRLIVDERPHWMKRIRDISLDEDMPLFADVGRVQESFEELGQLLAEHPRMGLEDLFDLHFEVGMPDGQVRRHAHLDAIESNGTTITIKVLTNLALLKGLLGDAEVRIPFYLDECSSLDSENLSAIVRAARDMGFVAVLASPEAMDAAQRLYFLRENDNGRVVLDPKTALVEVAPEGEDAGVAQDVDP